MSTGYGPGDRDGTTGGASALGREPDHVERVHAEPVRREVDPRGLEEAVVDREHEAYGGMKFGSAFFGWLTATGMAILLGALVTAAGTAIGLANGTSIDADAQTIGIVGGIVLLVILFVAYYAGGYVAGRMSRFDGARQGLAVWLWALVIAVVVAVLGLVAGSQFDVLSQVNAFPRIPINEGDLTTGGVIAAVLALLVTLGGAVLGGKVGVRYHRKVDHAGFMSRDARR